MLKVMKNDFLVFLAVWIIFPKFLGRLKRALLHEMIRMLHDVACPVVFVWFYDRYWQGGLLKFMKNYHIFSFNYQIIILAVCALSPKFLGRLMSSLG